MVIDAFAHIYPPPYVEHMRRIGRSIATTFQDAPEFMDAAARCMVLDRQGIDMQVLALGTRPFDELFESEPDAVQAARIANDGIAEIVARHADRFIGVATLPLLSLNALDAALGELDRAWEQLGLRGVQLYTDVGGEPLDRPALFPLYEKLTELGLPVLLHPKGGDYTPRTHDYMLWLTFGWPFETTLAASRLVYTGVLEKFPDLKIITHHLGAMLPHMAARVEGVTHTMQRQTGWSLPQPVLSYFRRLYADTAVNGFRPALDVGYQFFGADHILFGTDCPFVPVEPQIRAVRHWEIAASEREQILGVNARRLFGL